MPLVKYEHASLAILRVHALFYLPDVVFIALLFFCHPASGPFSGCTT